MELAASRKQKNGSVKLVALGGLGEIGLNLMVLECAGEALIIDAGVMFPEQRALGVDFAHPRDGLSRSASYRRGGSYSSPRRSYWCAPVFAQSAIRLRCTAAS